jgi:hypothetical protein
MIGQASETYVSEALALQRIMPSEHAPKQIAVALSMQLTVVAPAYAALPFEAEPSGFLAVVEREKR